MKNFEKETLIIFENAVFSRLESALRAGAYWLVSAAERQPVKDKNSDRNSQNNLFLAVYFLDHPYFGKSYFNVLLCYSRDFIR